MPISRSLSALATASFAGALLVTACSSSSSSVAKGDVEKEVAKDLAAQVNQPTPKVSCPSGLAGKVGTAIDCTLTPQGSSQSVPVHVVVDSVNGSTVHFTATVGGTGDKTAFCNDNATLDKATSAAKSPADVVAALKSNQSAIDDFAKNAPADIQTDANTLVNAAKQAISSGDPTPITAQDVQTAGANVDKFCSQNPDGSPATTTSAPPDTSGSPGTSGDTTTTG